jgi:two-component system cell cycle response regulator DivK
MVSSDATNWHVLLVEDTEDDIQVLSQIFQHYGVRVTIARSGIECLKLLETLEPTLVLMDLALPEMDGWSTLMAMRSNAATAHIPVIAITAYDLPQVGRQALQDGFDAYFPKPVHPSSFVRNWKGTGLAEFSPLWFETSRYQS